MTTRRPAVIEAFFEGGLFFFFFFIKHFKKSKTSLEILEPYTFLMSLMFSFRLHGLYYDVCSVVSTLSHLTTESYVQIFVSILKSWR